MTRQKFIKRYKLSPLANLKELTYTDEIKSLAPLGIERWIEDILKNRIPLIQQIKKEINFFGRILEIGAGSCWLSSELSKIPEVKTIYALDFSENLLRKIAPVIFKKLEAKTQKINLIVGDFHRLNFEDHTFDFVVADATLHHAVNLKVVLSELHRVLKNSGVGIFLREPVKALVPISLLFQKFGKKEKSFGVTENIYSRKQWPEFFRQAGFSFCLKPAFSASDIKTKITRYTPLRLLNGILYSRYYFVVWPENKSV